MVMDMSNRTETTTDLEATIWVDRNTGLTARFVVLHWSDEDAIEVAERFTARRRPDVEVTDWTVIDEATDPGFFGAGLHYVELDDR